MLRNSIALLISTATMMWLWVSLIVQSYDLRERVAHRCVLSAELMAIFLKALRVDECRAPHPRDGAFR
jgi:hypothetical protein